MEKVAVTFPSGGDNSMEEPIVAFQSLSVSPNQWKATLPPSEDVGGRL